MAYRFTGDYEGLKEQLASLCNSGEWRDLNDNQKQFRHNNGGILNWFPSTGSINFQGAPVGRKNLETAVRNLLAGNTGAVAVATTEEARSRTTTNTDQETAAATAVACAEGLLGQRFADSELVIGLVGAVGTELKKVVDVLKERLGVSGYEVEEVRISQHVIPEVVSDLPDDADDEHVRISSMMDAGNKARSKAGDNSLLALGAASWICSKRKTVDEDKPEHMPRRAYIINSLKHPAEVVRLREIYPLGFFLLGVHSDEKRRHTYLVEEKRIDQEKATELMLRDEDEHVSHGQRVADTFHMSDFFVRLEGNEDRLKHSVWRILEILFGHPYRTPTFDEYAMFMAFSASLRSADLSRQVGAVITKDNEILATGSNDCPKAGGGLYWPELNEGANTVEDCEDGRDYMRGENINKAEQQKIIDAIIEQTETEGLDRDKLRTILERSRIRDLTEYGRVVHAEMEALLCCSRNQVSARDGVLYCTTFPCHNCAKHIIAAGIKKVIYVEPYQKSKAAEFHSDAISLGFAKKNGDGAVHFEPFVGVGPRRFFDLFSMRLGSGYALTREDKDGQVVAWEAEQARLRLQMLPCSYLDLELVAGRMFNAAREMEEVTNG